MLEGAPDVAAVQEAAAAMGVALVGELLPPACEIWPEHADAVDLFIAMQTQWRTGMSGATGLDYAALPVVERRLGLSRRRAHEAFAHLRVMEAAALAWYASKREG